jgi:RNA polymerase sigma-70 factor (ECF subfamily)
VDALGQDPEDVQRLLEQVGAGDRGALDRLLGRYRDYLRVMVGLRMDPHLQARVDPSDVVQEARLEAARRITDFLERRPMPFHLWLRQTAFENLLRLRRQHVEAECRTVQREVPLPDGSSALLARQLLGEGATPSEQLAEAELAARLRQAVAQLPEDDREVVLMRNFEGLTNQEVSQVLGLDPAAASKRYGRALLRLRKVLRALGVTESQS